MIQRSCPKCGFHKGSGPECLRCGVIFARYRSQARPAQSLPEPEPAPTPPRLLRRLFRIARRLSYATAVVMIGLMLIPSPPPDVPTVPDAAASAERKLQALAAASRDHRPHTLKLDRVELNSWIRSNLALGPAAAPSTGVNAGSARAGTTPSTGPAAALPAPEPTIQEVQSSVRDVRIELLEDRLRAYVSFDLYGKEMSLMLEGGLRVENGYLRLDPIRGKLGSLPLLQSTLESAARRLFESEENREKFRVPPQIAALQIDRGVLQVTTR